MTASPYDRDLDRNPANFQPLTPLTLLRARLARCKRPRQIVFAEIPKTSTGKVQKFALRDRARRLDAPPA